MFLQRIIFVSSSLKHDFTYLRYGFIQRIQDKKLVVFKYHKPEEHMNIYEVPLTIKVNQMCILFPEC